jgi:hypothetical protein
MPLPANDRDKRLFIIENSPPELITKIPLSPDNVTAK